MCKLLSVTNRKLCREPFSERIEKVAKSGVDGVILREKDLSEAEYVELAKEVLSICRREKVACILHSFPRVAEELGADGLHLPLPVLRGLTEEERQRFSCLGASCHSLGDVLEAAKLGCSYVTLGHIFATSCKPGLPPRGVELLREVCAASPLPVYAIGGIGEDNISQVIEAGAAGACLMSGLMVCDDPAEAVKALRRRALEG